MFVIFGDSLHLLYEKGSTLRPGRPDRCISYGISMVSGGKFSKKIMETWNSLVFL